MIAIGGGSSMDTAKAIGIIINNPDFADVAQSGGRCRYKEQVSCRFLLYQRQQVQQPRLRSTMLLQMQRRTVRWYVLIHMIFRLLLLLIRR